MDVVRYVNKENERLVRVTKTKKNPSLCFFYFSTFYDISKH